MAPVSGSINGGAGGSLRAVARTAIVPSSTGVIFVPRAPLKSPVTVGSKTGNANLAVAVVGGEIQISATAAIAAGVSQTIGFAVTGADGCIQPWSLTLTGAYAIAAIVANVSVGAAAGAVIAAITGVPAGQTPVLSPADGRFVIAGDEATGWKLARGMSAISIGTFNGTISAAGAISGAVTLTIAAASEFILDVNIGGGTFIYNDQPFASEAALLAAIGGTSSGLKRTIGPFVAAAYPELVPDPTVTDPAKWGVAQTSGGSGVISGAISAGEWRIDASAAARPWAYTNIPVQAGRAYTLEGYMRKESGTQNISLGATNDPTHINGPASITALYGGATLSPKQVRNFSPCVGYETMAVGAFVNNANTTGVWAIDNLSVKECRPFDGWTDGSVSGVFTFPMPVAGATYDKVIVQFDDNAGNGASVYERSYVRLCAGTDGHVYLRVYAQTVVGTSGALQGYVDLGVVAPGATASVHLLATGGQIGAALNGGAPVTVAIPNFPGLAVMRIGAGQTVNTDNDTAVTRYAIHRTLTPPPGMTLGQFVIAGDSYGSAFASDLGTLSGKAPINLTTGGLHIDVIVDRILARPDLFDLPLIGCDGGLNGSYVSVAAYTAHIDRLIAARGKAKVIWIATNKRASTQAQQADIEAINAYWEAQLGSNFVKIQPIVALHGNGSTADNNAIAAGYCPPSLLPDEVHLSPVGRSYILGPANGSQSGTVMARLVLL